MRPKRLPGRPMGTDPNFSYVNANKLYIPLRAFDTTAFPGPRQDLCFEYVSVTSAARAESSIKNKLVDCSDSWSTALRSHYSNFNVLEFLARNLEHDGLQFMQWLGSVRLSGSNLACRLPNEHWEQMHFEDLTHTMIDWRPVSKGIAHRESAPTMLHLLHDLCPKCTWEAVTGISRPIWKCGFLIRQE